MKKILLFVIIPLAYIMFFWANKTLEKTVGYDYDSTLAFSAPTFFAEKKEDPAPRMNWELINGRLLKLEKKKHLAGTVAIVKFLGYTPIVVTARPGIQAEKFKEHVKKVYAINPEDVYMTKEKAVILKERKTVLFFGDSDGDITEAQSADVWAIRIKRSADDPHKENYHPGRYGEFVLPFSGGHF